MLSVRIDSAIRSPSPALLGRGYLSVEDDIRDSLIATFSAESYLICKVRHEVGLGVVR
jgi:hypothetical protein